MGMDLMMIFETSHYADKSGLKINDTKPISKHLASKCSELLCVREQSINTMFSLSDLFILKLLTVKLALSSSSLLPNIKVYLY